ncbi:MAG TPA: type II secretion system minor pseudopilin GspH [Woeseiaceae bacterium]|nr:type II secretion system minor pseudopilin GspH [Woeseiaceae bacterium]
MLRAVRSGSNKEVSGFTLIELLVVVVIIGIVSAMVLLSFGILGDDRALQQQARRMSSLVELATDEAMMQGRDFGLEFTKFGYRFVEHDPLTNQWHAVVDDELLRPRQLEEGMEFELLLEDRPVELNEKVAKIEVEEDSEETEDSGGLGNSDDRNSDDDYLPHVLILSSGDVTPFNLRLVRWSDRAEVWIEMTVAGEIQIRNEEQANAQARL